MASSVQAQFDSFNARLEAQEREIAQLKARAGRKGAGARGASGPTSRRDLLKLGGVAGAASLAAMAGLGRTETAEAAPGQVIVTGNNAVHEATGLTASATYSSDPFVLGASAAGATGKSVQGLRGVASGTEAGVYGTGGATNGRGVVGAGQGTGEGVHGDGGGASGTGVTGTGGATDGRGVSGTGVGNGVGIYGQGGDGGLGWGVLGQGGAGNGSGVVGMGVGIGVGAAFSGGRVPLNLALGSVAGPPTGFSYPLDVSVDSAGNIFVCVAQGTWVALQTGGSTDPTRSNFFRSAITTQPTLLSSDGTTWTDMSGGPTLSVTPQFKCTALLSANADLWTDTAGFNQDLGITVSGGAYPSNPGQPETWKESGGFAGTFSPNAAFVQTAIPLAAGITYTIKLQWKTNTNAPGAKIWAGAGPISGKFSPTSLAAFLIVTT